MTSVRCPQEYIRAIGSPLLQNLTRVAIILERLADKDIISDEVAGALGRCLDGIIAPATAARTDPEVTSNVQRLKLRLGIKYRTIMHSNPLLYEDLRHDLGCIPLSTPANAATDFGGEDKDLAAWLKELISFPEQPSASPLNHCTDRRHAPTNEAPMRKFESGDARA